VAGVLGRGGHRFVPDFVDSRDGGCSLIRGRTLIGIVFGVVSASRSERARGMGREWSRLCPLEE
jgi:hypothetical protein